jgi:TRAP transporter TAXI family solute receptor
MGDGVRFIDITPLLGKLQEISSVYEQDSIPASTYQTPGDVPTIVVPNYLLVKDDFADGNACAITKLIFDQRAELEKVHPAAKQILPDKARDTGEVPLHPGAAKALDSVG